VGRCPSSTLLWSVPHFYLLDAFPPPSTWGRWYHTCFLWPACLFIVHVGECLSPLQWSFPHDNHCYKLSPLQGCWMGPPLLPSPAGLQFTGGSASPLLSELRAHCPLCYVSFFFSAACLLFRFFSFFPWVGVSLLGSFFLILYTLFSTCTILLVKLPTEFLFVLLSFHFQDLILSDFFSVSISFLNYYFLPWMVFLFHSCLFVSSLNLFSCLSCPL
jgi:hypothetical protein